MMSFLWERFLLFVFFFFFNRGILLLFLYTYNKIWVKNVRTTTFVTFDKSGVVDPPFLLYHLQLAMWASYGKNCGKSCGPRINQFESMMSHFRYNCFLWLWSRQEINVCVRGQCSTKPANMTRTQHGFFRVKVGS